MKIIIINDSRAMRLFIEETIKSFSECQIIGSYFNAEHALDNIQFNEPDVIILDLEMPKMDGITFLERLNDGKMYPTIVLSNYATEGSKIVNDAISLGAVDSLLPPLSNRDIDIKAFKIMLRHKIIKASLRSKRYSLSCQ
ncbi:response regulator [Nitrosopumilus adriaticus]|uniref:Chemotaxis response regulator protein-glutamate methylesterase n=1 Tax=Nitrosopumilus adriaticus TaxID=1580092 RepID=A0A0D5C4V3_9ARCH|nr:response regulator [Nitrosopumilus adriaticus]AJW71761.1 chemotaxis response regulator protein-glutamate methylesterase [Nitrosopumilus adriaticus]